MPWPFRRKQSKAQHKSAYFSSEEPQLSYWLYFKDQSVAEAAVERLRDLELTADADLSAHDRKTWLVLAHRPIPESPDEAALSTRAVRALAASLGGEFDGWEAGPVQDEALQERLQAWQRDGVFD
jgi:AcrR family transcriptional regulator